MLTVESSRSKAEPEEEETRELGVQNLGVGVDVEGHNPSVGRWWNHVL